MEEGERVYRESARPSEIRTAQAVYILYLVGLIFGITALVGVIIAYVNRDDVPPWLATHYEHQIRTFWIGLLFFIASAVLLMILIGYILVIVTIIWYTVRCVKGLKYLGKEMPYPDPRTWWI